MVFRSDQLVSTTAIHATVGKEKTTEVNAPKDATITGK